MSDATRGRNSPDAGGLDALGPLIATAVFAYYGFLARLETIGDDGNPIPLWVTFVWVLRGAAVLSAIAVACAFLRKPWCRPAYVGCELLSTLGILGILVWDLSVPDGVAIHPLLLLVLVILGGFNVASALRR